MNLAQHCQHSIELFGKPFEEVHLWLDEFQKDPLYKSRHRRKRHHKQGIEQVRELFGEGASLAATQHIIDDIASEDAALRKLCPTYKDFSHLIPENEENYVKRGYW